MSFKDYSTTPASNTTLGDGTYVGPNMFRDKVRPAIQQVMADGKELADEVTALGVDFQNLPAGPPGINGGAGSGSGFAALFAAANGMAIASGDKRIKMDGHSLPGLGGADYIYDAAVTSGTVAANPRTQFLAADGRGFKLDPSQRLTIQMFGVVAGGSIAANGASNLAGILAAIAFKPLTGDSHTPTVHWPMGNYYTSATINVHSVVHWIGEGGSGNFGSINGRASKIISPTDVCTIINHSSTTTETGERNPGDKNLSAETSIYEQLSFEQFTQGTSPTAYGFWMRGACTLRHCTIVFTASHGIYMYATAGVGGGLIQGSANNWVLDHVFCHTIGGDGLHIRGQDANAGRSIQFMTGGIGIGGCGICDVAGIVNTHINPQITGYGNTGITYPVGGVQHRFQFMAHPSTVGGGVGVVPGTDPLIWYDLGEGAVTANFPAWDAATQYSLKMPIYIGSNSRVIGGYCENSTTRSHAPNGMIDGPFRCTTMTSLSEIIGTGARSFAAGVGSRRYAYNTLNDPYYTFMAGFAQTIIGGKNPVNQYERPNILEHQVDQDGTAVMYWLWSGKDQFLKYHNTKNIFSIGGPATTRTYGRDTAQPYYFSLHDYGLIDPTNSNNARIFGLRSAIPASGLTARGDQFAQMNATAGSKAGWITTTTGTAGSTAVIKPFGAIDA